ncbi:hypothetical protein GEMRC1_013377 [Eukaryota sp. GEM-RC1]
MFFLFFCCSVLATLHQWTATTDGVWSDSTNWLPSSPTPSSSVVLPVQSTSLTVVLDSNITVYSLTVSSHVVLLFQNNSTLTVTDVCVINGGKLSSDVSSPLSLTYVDSLVIDTDLVTLVSHKLSVTKLFNWKRGSIDLDSSSELILTNCTSSFNNNDSLESSDVLHVWGQNSFGGLGGELSGNQDFPISFTMPVTIRQVSAGWYHSVVLSTSGDVYTSGSNDNGQLGYVSGNSNIHRKIEISDIIQVATPYSSNLALSIHGSVFAWGQNNYGQLGLGDLINRLTPTLIPELDNIVQIAGRFRTSFALTTDGKVYGWGWGGSGTYSTLTEFANDFEFTFIDTISDHAVGIDVNQKLLVWGLNNYYQLGNGGTAPSPTPVEVTGIDKLIVVVAGYRHTIAIDVNNDVWSWGDNADNGLALGRIATESSSLIIPGIVAEVSSMGVNGIASYQSNFAFISVAPSFLQYSFKLSSLFLSSSTFQSVGAVFYEVETLELEHDSLLNLTQHSIIFANNVSTTLHSSELYYSDSFFSLIRHNNWKPAYLLVPSTSVVLPAQTFLIVVGIRSDVFLASLTISSHVVLLFQNNSTLTVTDVFVINGGNLTSDVSSPLSLTYVDSLVIDTDLVTLVSHKLSVTKFFNWKRGSIDLDSSSELILTNCTSSFNDNDSLESFDVLHVWGQNSFGSLGGELSGNQDFPISFTMPVSIRQVSAGKYHSVVLSTSGDVYTSGSNDNGQLGYVGGNSNIHRKIEISGVVQIAVLDMSNLALSIHGSVFTWGQNSFGQLGLGDLVNRQTPTLIPELNNIIQISGRYRTSFALTTDGKVYGWGSGLHNILCSLSVGDVESPTLIESLENIKFIAAGLAAFFIKEDGSTLTCGRRLAHGGTYSTPTEFSSNLKFSFIDTFNEHALAIDVNQKLWGWGQNSYVQLGTGGNAHTPTPVEVQVIRKVITVSAGWRHSVAVDVNNDVWTWGDNADGALGRIPTGKSPASLPGLISEVSGNGISVISACYMSSIVSSSVLPVDITGAGQLSLIDSDVTIFSSKFELRSISLTSTTLQSIGFIINDLETLQLYSDSVMRLTQNSTIVASNVSITLNSSELYYDDSIHFSPTTLSLIAFNSRFQNDFAVSDFHILNLSFSTFESALNTDIVVVYFWCYHCQILAISTLEITTLSEIHSGNFSSSLNFQETVSQSSVSGDVQLAGSFDFFSHVTLSDVTFSDFQISSNSLITCHTDVTLNFFVVFSSTSFTFHSDIFLSDADLILDKNLELLDFQMLSGDGTVFDSTSHSGTIKPLPSITFDNDLFLSSSSFFSLKILNTNSSSGVFIGSTVYIDGILEIEFDPFQYWSGKQFLLISSSNIIGEFTSIKSTCSSIFKVNYTSNSLIGSFDEYVAHLDEVSYISTTGYDDPCCGTFSSPCASFKGVLERMGRKGTVYVHEGRFSFNEGLSNISCVDWEVIGLGDVIIEGMGETLFEFKFSNFSFSHVNIQCTSFICFRSSDTVLQLNNSEIRQESGHTTFFLENSTLVLTNCLLKSNSSSVIKSLDSNSFLFKVNVSGLISSSALILEDSQIEILDINFVDIDADTLILLVMSQLLLNHSTCSNSKFSDALFNFSQSTVYQHGFSLDFVNTQTVFAINLIVCTFYDFLISSAINFDQLISAEFSDIRLISFNLFDFDSSNSLIYVINSSLHLLNSQGQNLICDSLVESVSSFTKLTEFSLFNVVCDTCFKILGNGVFVDSLDLFNVSGTLFVLVEVELLTVNFLNFHDTVMTRAVLALNSTFHFTDILVLSSKFEIFLQAEDSHGSCQHFLFNNSSFNNVFNLIDVEVSLSDFWSTTSHLTV